MTNWKEWRHITKLDPDKVLGDGAIAEIAASGTDVLMLSGT
ncbi:MAG: geranylgeranylglyceryl/heptaprenylglyceryl phosphate synthase, partial [Methanocorpusculum sp.]|nr:geranylgeranylglyceryl/heptaprenylglyceryl phosphate synthase [Methanocorpusculum sp.]